MGSWSDDIFGNDMARDVRDQYRDCIVNGDDVAAAVKRVKKEFAIPLRDGDDKWVVWIALAATQLDAGSLTDDVREKALQGIGWCEDPNKGFESSPFDAAAISALREQLGGSAPEPANKAKPQIPPGAKGDVVAVKFPNSDGEAVIIVGDHPGHDRRHDSGRVVLLQDLSVAAVTPESVEQAMLAWRPYRQVWPNGLGASIGVYDAHGKLPARRTRVLLRGVTFPPPFEQRMRGVGRIERSADIPWVVENDVNAWRSHEWVVDPSDHVELV
jgi:hypothetical protein